MIIYFSGTGNSRYVAEKLLNAGEKLVDAAKEEFTVCDESRLGVVFPCYCGDMPPKLIEFMKKSVINKPDYAFAVCTCGASAGRSFSSLKYLLCSKGATLDFAESLVMPDSCVLYAFPRRVVKKLLDSADERIGRIKAKIDGAERKETKAKKPLGFRAKAVWFMFGRIVGVYKKHADENCVGCGECLKVCKAGNIKIENGKAVFGEKAESCYQCFACINVCPKCAVRFGTLKNSEEKKYYHPAYRGAKEE